MFLWTFRMQFRQLRRKKKCKKRARVFLSLSEIDKKASFSKSKTFSSNCSTGLVYSSFDNPTGETSLKFWTISTEFWKWLRTRFYRRELFLKNFVWPGRRRLWQAAPEKKLIRAKNFQWKSKWGEEHQSLSQKSLFQFVLTDIENAILINSPVNFWQTGKKMFHLNVSKSW